MLEGIGTISSYLQMKDLRLQAKTKLRTGKSLKEQQAEWRRQVTEQNLAAQKTKKKKDASDDTRTSIITQKLRRGQELSAEELKYLKEKGSGSLHEGEAGAGDARGAAECAQAGEDEGGGTARRRSGAAQGRDAGDE